MLLGGCGNRNAAALRPADANANPDVLVRTAVESKPSLTSLHGRGVIRIVDQPSRFGLTVNADVVADESERLRIRADKLAGAIQAFDVVMLKDDIGFYVPTQKTLYHGKVGDLGNFAFRFDPYEVLRQMLRPETALLLRKWEHVNAGRDDPRNAIILQEIAQPNRPYLRLAINRKNSMLMQITQLDARGEPLLIKKFDDYRKLTRGRSAQTGVDEPVFPYLISFNWPRDSRSMEMQFKQVDGNAVVTDEDFDIATTADTNYRPLMEARVDDMSDEPMVGAAQAPAGPRAM
ncbi:MAG: hypothetical protein LIP23_05020 [Planctomycetes bacterium]|nr:hypothetical protein [Planctomycetota bacterium]